MPVITYKILDYKGKDVASASDRLLGNASENKGVFDRLTKEVVCVSYNELIDYLSGIGIDNLIVSEDVRYLRLNADGAIETSTNGQTWTQTASSGHIILDGQGIALPQRSRMQFNGSIVKDVNGVTVVEGIKGDKGDKGEKGDTGAQGVQGIQGVQGLQGIAIVPSVSPGGVISWQFSQEPVLPNSQNIRGPQGVQGVQGVQGAQGVQGSIGPQGPKGETGSQGPKGLTGQQGEIGPRGPKGEMGDPGPRGPQGAQGIQGVPGAIGPGGPQGLQGIQGATGANGDKGDPGATGARGPQGIQGPIGPQGSPGIAGADGKSFTIQDVYSTLAALRNALPSGNEFAYMVRENNCVYIWSEIENDWISLGQLQGPKGEQGIQGLQGLQGDPGPAGADGARGPQGEQGIQGPQGIPGVKGDTGAQGIQGPEGPQGVKGEKGDTGPRGETGAPGLKGDKGDKGDPGDPGAQGIQGEQGIQGIQGVPGKSAYQSAFDSGYTGTEQQFNTSLADIENHMKQASSFISGNLISFDANGNASDSGSKTTDFAPSSHTSDPIVHVTAQERQGWNDKVDKVTGKGLSTEDYTTPEKQKLSNAIENTGGTMTGALTAGGAQDLATAQVRNVVISSAQPTGTKGMIWIEV